MTPIEQGAAALICDAHMHVLGDADRYPPGPEAFYRPVPKTLVGWRAAYGSAPVPERMVIVQPSVYGGDHACTADAIAEDPVNRRGIATVAGVQTAADVAALDAAGFCGLRLHLVSKPGLDPQAIRARLRAMADLVGPHGWHLQVFARAALLDELLEEIDALPVPVVIDHLGMPDPAQGLDQPGFARLLRVLEKGRLWAKLSGLDRAAGDGPMAPLLPFVRALGQTAPDRLVWGSDWPHIRRRAHGAEYAPVDLPGLLAFLTDTLGEAPMRRVLTDNPARLYGF